MSDTINRRNHSRKNNISAESGDRERMEFVSDGGITDEGRGRTTKIESHPGLYLFPSAETLKKSNARWSQGVIDVSVHGVRLGEIRSDLYNFRTCDL